MKKGIRMKRPAHRRKGTIYLPVLAASLIAGIIGISAIWLGRIEIRQARLEEQRAEAHLYARSALEMGLYWMGTDLDWRQHMIDGTYSLNWAIGSGSCSLIVEDPVDGDLADSDSDPVRLTGIGIEGPAQHKTEVLVECYEDPMSALGTCLQAAALLKVRSGCVLTAIGAPVCTNDELEVDGTIMGDAECWTRTGGGTVVGSLEIGAAPKLMPDAGVIDTYISWAVAIGDPEGTIEKFVLSPASNPWGATDTNGIYFIDTGGGNLKIKYARISGTLIIRTGGGKVEIEEAVFMEPFSDDLPVLIVDGDLEIKTKNADGPLDEDACNTNFNPDGTPYLGTSDDDQLDTYPNEIRGLIHVTGTFKTEHSPVIDGVVIAEDEVECKNDEVTFIHDASIYQNPPAGYTVTRVRIAPGSWRQVVD